MYDTDSSLAAKDTLSNIHRCCDIYAESHDVKNTRPDYDTLLHNISTNELNAFYDLGNDLTSRAYELDRISKNIFLKQYSDNHCNKYDRLLELLSESTAYSYNNQPLTPDLSEYSYSANLGIKSLLAVPKM